MWYFPPIRAAAFAKDTRMKPSYFTSPAEWRAWLESHHAARDEIWVGYHKRATGKPSLTWPESVDQALCFGWIDGIRKRVDDDRYTIRFTPRRAGSTWSLVNTKRVAELKKKKRMRPAGLRAFEARTATGVYSYEQRRDASLGPDYEKVLKADAAAWKFFKSRPPGYQRLLSWWVISAKKEETRLKRLAMLIDRCAEGRTIGSLTPK